MQNPSRDERPAAVPNDAAPATESLGAPAPADPPAVKAAATKAAAAKKPAKGSAKGGKSTPRNFVFKPKGPDLRADLRAFIQAQPGGWGHDDWIAFLDHLRERGHDTSDAEAIGQALERERLAATLERIQGMGPRRVQAVVDRYDTLYSACRAGVDEIAALPGMNRSLAEKVRQALS